MPADNTRQTVLTPGVIRDALERLADALADADAPVNITLYGGASLALSHYTNDRTATADVDGTYHPVDLVDDEPIVLEELIVVEAVGKVAVARRVVVQSPEWR